jgi:lipoate-protein ligase A
MFEKGTAVERPFVYLYEQQTVEIVHGPSFIASEEIFADRCAVDGVSIVERRGGGGTVVLSPGTLVILVAGDRIDEREWAPGVFRRVNGAIIAALNKAGIGNTAHAGISDVAVDGRKVLGSSLYMGSRPPLFYYQASLLVSSDIGLLDRYLRHPPREPDYRRGRGHSEFCATLARSGLTVGMKELAGLIEAELRGAL